MKANGKEQILGEGLSVLFFALVVAAANATQLSFILFPELGALASDVLVRPGGKWANEPWKLILTPTATAVVGIGIGTYLPYGVGTVLLTMLLSIGIIYVLRSAVAPAISAGVLPVVLGVTSWLYPLCVLGSLSVLTGILLVWRSTPVGKCLVPDPGPDPRAVERLETPPMSPGWLLALVSFVAIMGTAAQVSGWRFILFPPLIVMAYEMFGHPDTCPWAKALYTFPLVCTSAALAGVALVQGLGVNPVATSIVLLLTYALLRAFRLRMPPALAIGLIPFILAAPSYRYAASVAIGTCALTASYLVYRRIQIPRTNR